MCSTEWHVIILVREEGTGWHSLRLSPSCDSGPSELSTLNLLELQWPGNFETKMPAKLFFHPGCWVPGPRKAGLVLTALYSGAVTVKFRDW